jgi:DNA modification methylase
VTRPPPKRPAADAAIERRRKPLSDLGGPVRTGGEPERADLLRRAMEAAASADPDELTHGFHAYTARMHPAIARTIVRAIGETGDIVADPFCGSGTVVLEAMIAGRRALGIDLNPLAIRVAEVKCDLRDAASRKRFLKTLEEVGERSEARVRARVYVRAPLPPWEARYWEPHVLKELAGLREEILAVEDEDDRRTLEVLLSAIVVKFSKQRSDTDERDVPKRIRKGLSTEFFVRRGRELAERWEALYRVAPRGAKRPKLFEDDARNLPELMPRRARADLILASPPYGGTYDYVQHHARRFRWLGVDPRGLESGEVGARRNLRGDADASRWDRELGQSLRAMERTIRRGAPVILLIGDARLGRMTIDAEHHVRRLTERLQLKLLAGASQPRRDARREHLLWLELG